MDMLHIVILLPKKRIRPLVHRRSDKQTKNLPNRIEALADEIQQVNERSVLINDLNLQERIEARERGLSPHGLAYSTIPAWKRKPVIIRTDKDDFECLPETLRSYAKCLRELMTTHREFLSTSHRSAIWIFLERVRAVTGDYHYRQVTNLLEAVCVAEGLSEAFNVDQLKMLKYEVSKQCGGERWLLPWIKEP